MTSQLPVSEWRVLFFSPNAGIWQSSQLEHEIANGLAKLGAQVTVVRCRGLFGSFCPTMQASSTLLQSSIEEKRRVCKSCRRDESVLNSVSKYTTIWLDDFVNDVARIDIESTISQVSKSNWQQLHSHSIPIGVYSTYLSMLHHKVSDVTASTQSWDEFLSDAKNSLLAARALPQIIAKVEPTHAVVYNPLYPTNRVFTELIQQQKDVQYVGLSASGFIPDRYSTIALYRSIESSQTAIDSNTLIESMNVPLSELEISMVERHLGQLIQGKDPWVYSTAPTSRPTQEIREYLGLKRTAPVAVVLIGSPDETRSSALVEAEFERVPIDQISAVQEFISQSIQAAELLPEVDFIFRLHPRLAPNKRESLRSPDLDDIEKLLVNRPGNVTINSPGDEIGLYDIARIASCGINHASSAGLEFLALGIPVVHYDPPRLNAYPPNLGFEAPRLNAGALAQKIQLAIDTPASTEIAVRAWRWYAVSLLRAVTHKSWINTAVQMENAQSNSAARNFQWLRNLLPESFRERVSRAQAQRKRKVQMVQIEQSLEPAPWVYECVERISGFDNSTIWNPLALVRGISLGKTEESLRIGQGVLAIWNSLGRK